MNGEVVRECSAVWKNLINVGRQSSETTQALERVGPLDAIAGSLYCIVRGTAGIEAGCCLTMKLPKSALGSTNDSVNLAEIGETSSLSLSLSLSLCVHRSQKKE